MRDSQFVREVEKYTAELDAAHGTIDAAEWLRRYESEAAKIREAFDSARKLGELHSVAVKIALHTAWYWYESGRAREGAEMFDAALDLPQRSHKETAELERFAGMFAFALGDYDAAVEFSQRALEHGLEIEPPEPLVRYHTQLANALLYSGGYEQAEQYYRLALDSAQSHGNANHIALAKFNLAIYLFECLSDFAGARKLLAASLRDGGADAYDEALGEETLARIAYLERDVDAAVRHGETALTAFFRLGNVEHGLEMAMRQAVYLCFAGRCDEAAQLWARHERAVGDSKSPELRALALEASAALATAQGNLSLAVEQRARLQSFRETHALAVFPAEQRNADAWEHAALAILGRAAYDAARTRGADG